VKITPKTLIDQHLIGTAETAARTRVTTRDVAVVIDEPLARHGTNMGLTPTETLMASLIGCTNVVGTRLAQREGVTFQDMKVEAHATLDRRGAALETEIDVPFPLVKLTITVCTDATPAQLDHIGTELGRYCPIAKILRAAGTKLEETWIALPL
jgi:putative redox protein